MQQLFNKLITVNRPAYGQGSNFGVTSTTSAAYSNIPASVQPATSTVQDFYAQRQISVTQTVFVDQAAYNLSLKRGDIINDGTLNYQVQGWRDLTGRGRVLAIDCIIYEA
jgi:hypothetical protein